MRQVWIMFVRMKRDGKEIVRAVHATNQQAPYIYRSRDEAQNMLDSLYPQNTSKEAYVWECSGNLANLADDYHYPEHIRKTVRSLLLSEDGSIEAFASMRDPCLSVKYPELFSSLPLRS